LFFLDRDVGILKGVSEALIAPLGILPRTLHRPTATLKAESLLGILAYGYIKLLTVIDLDQHTVPGGPNVLILQMPVAAMTAARDKSR